MPGRNGTGPLGQGPVSGRGMGQGAGRGRMAGNRPGAGPGGKCLCPNCRLSVDHRQGVPCSSMKCPKCGGPLVRS